MPDTFTLNPGFDAIASCFDPLSPSVCQHVIFYRKLLQLKTQLLLESLASLLPCDYLAVLY